MHAVDLEQGEYVELFLDVLHGDEVAARIEHDAAIAKAWLILDAHGRSCPGDTFHYGWVLDLSGKQLQERLHTIEKTLRCFRFDGDIGSGHVQGVTLIVQIELTVDQEREAVGCSFVCHADLIASSCVQLGSEELSHRLGLWGRGIELCVFAQLEVPLVLY